MDAPFPTGMMTDIESFFKDIHPHLIPGLDVYPDVFQRPLFFPLQRQNEMWKMMRIAREILPTTVFEIGTDKGGSLYHWCMSLPTVRNVIACEIRGTPYEGEFRKAFPHIDFLFLPDSSYSDKSIILVKEFLYRHKTDISCLFIDGDKSHFVKDFLTYLPTMYDNGIVFMHDIQDANSGTRAAFEKVISKGYKHKRIIDTDEVTLSLDREKNGFPCANPHEGWLRYWRGRSCGVGVVYIGEIPKHPHSILDK